MQKSMMQIIGTLVLVLLFVVVISVLAQRKDSAEFPKVPEGIMLHRDMAYVTDGHERQKLDLYVPDQGENLPLIIWIHGGCLAEWRQEALRPDGIPQSRLCRRKSQLPLESACHLSRPNRGCKSRCPVAASECGDLSSQIPNRFAAWGSSAGGHLVAMLGTTDGVAEFEVGENLEVSSRVQAVVDYFGPH